jgi:hypothetical protein
MSHSRNPSVISKFHPVISEEMNQSLGEVVSEPKCWRSPILHAEREESGA